MSRSTTALKRLGVPGLAAVTAIAGLPLFLGTAQAAHVGSLTMTPETASASIGTCRAFTVTLAPSAGSALDATEDVDVILTERAASGSQTVSFCQTAAAGETAPSAPNAGGAGGTPVGTAGTTTHGEFTGARAADGTVTVKFGVTATEAGTVDIRAFYEPDTADNNTFDGTELTDTSVLTVSGAAGASGSQARADQVTSVDAEPEAGNSFVGEVTTITATLKNASGDTVAGVTPDAVFNSGPNSAAALSCDLSDNNGVSRCTYTPTTTGTDSITVFVDKTQGTTAAPIAPNNSLDANEPQDTVTNTVSARPTGLAVVLRCDGPATDANRDTCVNPTSDKSEGFSATVTAADGADAGTERDPVAGVVVRFTENGANATVAPVEATTDATGVAKTTLTRTNTGVETIVVTAVIRGQDPDADDDGNAVGAANIAGQDSTDTATKEFRANSTTAADARNITLTPESATSTPGDATTFTATVVDRFGIPVQGVGVTFSESGPGRFVNGSSSVATTTDANGQATVEAISFQTESGAQTITATITSRGPLANDDNCEQLAGFAASGAGPVAQGGSAPAGNCSDSSTNNIVSSTPSPSPTSATPTPTGSSAPNCAVTPTVTLEFGTINATGSSGVTVNAPANSQIQLLAYSQPSTTYRVVRQATIDNTGTPAQFRIVPPTNTRLYAQIVGCDTDETRFSKVLNVRTTLSLNVTRTGVRAYRFFGDSLPARPGGLIVSLYRVTDSGQQVLTAQTRADAQNGDWVINRVFTGTGRFGFVVRTGQDLQNAPGASNVRSLLIF